ncbi:transcription factor sdnS [Cladorrhinum sp. PSN259]|nr:transcription factor sdnS [Cladorrhinum sp. PSN259]
MTEIPPSPHQTEAEIRRRKIRKGTHSCWECRRRKIRCKFAAGDDAAVCLPCQARGSVCRSQEFVDSSPPQLPDRRLAQRLGRLEDLMAKVVDRVFPEAGSGPSSAQNHSRHESPAASNYTGSVDEDDAAYRFSTDDVLGPSIVEDNPIDSIFMTLQSAANRVPSIQGLPVRTTSSGDTRPSSNARGLSSKYDKISQTLYSLFPSQQDVDTITKPSVMRLFVVSFFSCYRDQVEGKCETPDTAVCVIPPANSHPTVLSRRLLQLCACLNHGPVASGKVPTLELRTTPREYVLQIMSTVTHLVANNDDLVATAEGLQTLALLGYLDANLGNLRKSWLTFRRAISLAILMGIDRPPHGTPASNYRASQLRYTDPSVPLAQRPTPQALWYRINACDRSLSLMLGLPVGSQSNTFATEAAMARDTQQERLGRLHAVVSRRIIERNAVVSLNSSKLMATYPTASQIGRDLENGARAMGQDWWDVPSLDSALDQPTILARTNQLILQIHHFDLENNVHLPYMMGPAKSDIVISPEERQHRAQSKAACCTASREILKRFVVLRSQAPTWPCRRSDYSALMAAMTLLLGYLYTSSKEEEEQQTVEAMRERDQDKRLLEIVRERMQHLAVVNRDKLSRESADIMGQMLPVLLAPEEQEDGQVVALVGCGEECASSSSNQGPQEGGGSARRCINLNVPYFGVVSMHPVYHRGGQFHAPAPQQEAPRTAPMALRDTQMHIDYSRIDPALGGHGGFSQHTLHGGMHMQYETHGQGHDSGMDACEMPLTSGPDGWVFSGIETSYWSLMNPNGMQG